MFGINKKKQQQQEINMLAEIDKMFSRIRELHVASDLEIEENGYSENWVDFQNELKQINTTLSYMEDGSEMFAAYIASKRVAK